MKSIVQANELPIEIATLKQAALVYRAINHKLRQDMMRLLQRKERITVSEIYKMLRLEQSVASQHLAILREAGFVKTERYGKFIFYSVNRQKLDNASQIATAMLRT